MKYALFLGCTIPARLNQYEESSRAVLERFSVELVDIRDFNCCGYPLRNYDFKSFLLSSARNLAFAGRENLNIITLCKCCYGSLKKAESVLKEDSRLNEEIRTLLKREKLEFNGDIEVKHLLSVLYHDIGIDAIKKQAVKPYHNLKIAAHYGCHALRPSEVVQFDDPDNPRLFDELVRATGAESIYWQYRLECCGAPLMGVNDELSNDIMQKKLKSSSEVGADYLTVACPYCHLQFDRVRNMINTMGKAVNGPPSVLFTQLLGLSMGIDSETLNIGMNEIDISGLAGYL